MHERNYAVHTLAGVLKGSLIVDDPGWLQPCFANVVKLGFVHTYFRSTVHQRNLHRQSEACLYKRPLKKVASHTIRLQECTYYRHLSAHWSRVSILLCYLCRYVQNESWTWSPPPPPQSILAPRPAAAQQRLKTQSPARAGRQCVLR